MLQLEMLMDCILIPADGTSFSFEDLSNADSAEGIWSVSNGVMTASEGYHSESLMPRQIGVAKGLV